MTVLYIILGIIVGVPAYLLLNTLLVLFARLFAAMMVFLWPWQEDGSSFMNEIKGGNGSFIKSVGKSGKVLGLCVFICAVLLFVVGLIGRLIWLVCQVFRAWLELIKFCWNLGSKTKSKAEAK